MNQFLEVDLVVNRVSNSGFFATSNTKQPKEKKEEE